MKAPPAPDGGRRPGGRGLRLAALAAAAIILAAATPLAAASRRLERIEGPHGLAGWHSLHRLENGNDVSETLTIARNGKVIRRIKGDPFVWRWLFRADGRGIAYETGPLHFSLACVLTDTDSGAELQRLDSFRYPEAPPPGGWPDWVVDLQSSN